MAGRFAHLRVILAIAILTLFTIIWMGMLLIFAVGGIQQAVADRGQIAGGGQAALFAAAGRRYLPLRPYLPIGEPVGYIADQPAEDSGYVRALYTLPPAVIVEGAACCDLAIGDFSSSAAAADFVARDVWRLSADLGDGLVLLERAGRTP